MADVAHAYLNVSIDGGGVNEASAAVTHAETSDVDDRLTSPVAFTSVSSAKVVTVGLNESITMVTGVFGTGTFGPPIGAVRNRWMVALRISASSEALADALKVHFTRDDDPDGDEATPVVIGIGPGEIQCQRADNGALQFWAIDPASGNRVIIANVPPNF